MDKPSFRLLFYRPKKVDQPSAQALADGGEPEAQFNLGVGFANGVGAAQDYLQAAHWYGKAADQNHAMAQFNLGVMFTDGQGVVKDDTQAGVWFGRAAQQGHAGAQFNLGVRERKSSYNGLPAAVAECQVEAYKWFRLAAVQGYRGSQEAFEGLALRLSWDQVREGDARAKAFTVTGTNPGQS